MSDPISQLNQRRTLHEVATPTGGVRYRARKDIRGPATVPPPMPLLLPEPQRSNATEEPQVPTIKTNNAIASDN